VRVCVYDSDGHKYIYSWASNCYDKFKNSHICWFIFKNT